MASYASLGDLILAEPGAMVGFAGPRVIKDTTQAELPPASRPPNSSATAASSTPSSPGPR